MVEGMTFPRSRILLALLLTTLTGALLAPAASQAAAGNGTSATAAKKHRLAPRKGGHVRKAWPAKKSRGKRPNKKLAQFLAKQVGPKAMQAPPARGPQLGRDPGLPPRPQAERAAARALLRRARRRPGRGADGQPLVDL